MEQPQWDGWVYDFDTKEPISIHKALFEKTDVQSPMGSGWTAHKPLSQDENEYLKLDKIIEKE